MITCCVSASEDHWQDWLDAVGNLRRVRDVALPVSLLVTEPAIRTRAERLGLTVSHAQDLLPADVARYLSESPARGRKDVLSRLKDMLVQCRAAGARVVGFELGLDRIREAAFAQDLTDRVKLLRALMPVADSQKVTLCVQVRYPREFPHSKQWEYAGNLVHEVMHPCCRLGISMVPAELPADFDIGSFVRLYSFNLGALRFHYSPAMGETLGRESQARWAEALRRHGFKGLVVFCPKVKEPEGIPEASAAIDAWAEAYAG